MATAWVEEAPAAAAMAQAALVKEAVAGEAGKPEAERAVAKVWAKEGVTAAVRAVVTGAALAAAPGQWMGVAVAALRAARRAATLAEVAKVAGWVAEVRGGAARMALAVGMLRPTLMTGGRVAVQPAHLHPPVLSILLHRRHERLLHCRPLQEGFHIPVR